MAQVTAELVAKAYDALNTLDKAQCQQYWADDMAWLVPGHNLLSGWHNGLDAYLGFMRQVGALSANSFHMQRVAVMLGDDCSADVTNNIGYREGSVGTGEVPYHKLSIDVIHFLRWRDGKIIEGRGAIFGDGTTQYDQFWSRLGAATPQAGPSR